MTIEKKRKTRRRFVPKTPAAENSPNVVHASMLNYFRTEFSHGKTWTHPVTGQQFDSAEIKNCLKFYKANNRKNYQALWWLWTSGATATFIADRLRISTSTLRRRWDNAFNVLLVLLLHPDLTCEEAVLYETDW